MASYPQFVNGPFGSAPTAPVSFSTPNNDLSGATSTGMTTVVQGGTNGSMVREIVVRAITHTRNGTLIYVFHNTGGTRTNVGHIVVSPSINPSQGHEPWEGRWVNPNAEFFLKSGDKFDLVARDGTTTYIAWAIGGDY